MIDDGVYSAFVHDLSEVKSKAGDKAIFVSFIISGPTHKGEFKYKTFYINSFDKSKKDNDRLLLRILAKCMDPEDPQYSLSAKKLTRWIDNPVRIQIKNDEIINFN